MKPAHDSSTPDESLHCRPLRILHCPTNVGGHPQSLARAERELGLASHAASFDRHPFDYPIDELLDVGPRSPIHSEIRRWRFLARAIREFDVVHFNFGRSILPMRVPASHPSLRGRPRLLSWLYRAYAAAFEMRDLRWFRRAGIPVVITYQGDDARQGDFCRRQFEISIAADVEPGYYCDAGDACKRRRIRIVEQYASRIFAVNPDLLHVLPRGAEFLPYANVDPRDWMPPPEAPGTRRRPVVVHAPSHRGAKGTAYLLEAVRRLEQEGVEFEFVLVENLSHAAARELYLRADLLVDQLVAGWYGGLAVELMALGRPAICYLRDEDLRFLPPAMRARLPLIHAAPTTIYDVLKHWVTAGRSELAARGAQSRAYVEEWHDPRRIAAQLKRTYESLHSAATDAGDDAFASRSAA